MKFSFEFFWLEKWQVFEGVFFLYLLISFFIAVDPCFPREIIFLNTELIRRMTSWQVHDVSMQTFLACQRTEPKVLWIGHAFEALPSLTNWISSCFLFYLFLSRCRSLEPEQKNDFLFPLFVQCFVLCVGPLGSGWSTHLKLPVYTLLTANSTDGLIKLA